MEKRHRIYPSILLKARELRQPQTPAEATLWRHLRNRNLGYKFRRQHSIDRFIIDLYCAEAKLCIEVDGSSHFEKGQEEYDISSHPYPLPSGGRESNGKLPSPRQGEEPG